MTYINENPAHHGHDGSGAAVSVNQNQYTADVTQSKETTSPNLSVALKYARAGLKVFPCDPTPKDVCDDRIMADGRRYVSPNKKPILVSSWPSDATTEENIIRGWWLKNPNALVGLPCGLNGLFVIDADDHGDANGIAAFNGLLERHGALPVNAVTSITQSGSKHYFFSQPDERPLGNSSGNLPKGMDVRGDGGYVIAPGTVWLSPNGEKREWLEELDSPILIEGLQRLPEPSDWIIDLIAPRRREPDRAAKSDHSDAERNYICAALRHLDPNDRDDWLLSGGALHDTGYSWAHSEWDSWSRLSHKYDAAEQQKAWGSFSRGAATRAGIGTIIARAQRNGFRANKRDFMHKSGNFSEDFTTSPTVHSAERQPDYLDGVWFHGDVPAAPAPTIIDGLLPASGCSFLGGQSGTGKTLIAIDIAVAKASGQSFAGRDTKCPAGVIYIAAEAADTIPARLAASVKVRGLEGQRLPIAVVTNVGDLSERAELENMCAKLAVISRRIEEEFGLATALVILDTLAASFSVKDENSPGEMVRVVRRASQLGKSVDGALLMLHHYGKEPSTGLRGSSSLRGDGAAILAVLAERNELTGSCTNRRLVHAKDRSGPEGATWPFEIRNVHLGNDDWEGPFGAGAIHFSTESACQRTGAGKRTEKKSPVIDHFLKSLERALSESGSDDIPDAAIHAKRIVEKQHVRAVFMEGWVTESDDLEKKAAAKRQAFKRGFAGALSAGHVGFKEIDNVDWVWRTPCLKS